MTKLEEWRSDKVTENNAVGRGVISTSHFRQAILSKLIEIVIRPVVFIEVATGGVVGVSITLRITKGSMPAILRGGEGRCVAA